jgi:hypothetical protein
MNSIRLDPYRDDEGNAPVYSGASAIGAHILNPAEVSSKRKLVALKHDFVRKEAVKLQNLNEQSGFIESMRDNLTGRQFELIQAIAQNDI